MKVAFVLDDSLNSPDGVQEYVRSIASYLGGQGHTVDVLCSGDGGEPPAGVRAVHTIAGNVGVGFNANRLRTPVAAARSRVRALLEAERYDVIHVQTPHSPLLAGRVVSEARRVQGSAVRIVATFHILPSGWLSTWGTRALGLLLRRNLRRFDAFAAVSAPAAVFARASFGIDCRVVPNAIDVTAFRAAVRTPRPRRGPHDRLVLGFLGRMVERKGVLELVEAVAALPPEVRERLDVRLGGRGPLLAQVEQSVARHDLAGVVSLLGFVAQEDKAQFYADCDLAVFPATGGESFGIVLIEAMAAGAGAVLAGDNPGYAWTIDDPAAVIDATHAGAFADLIARLVNDPAAREDLHARQQQRLEDFDLPVVGAQVEALYGWR